MLRHVCDGDRGVAEHACGESRPHGAAGHAGASLGVGGQGAGGVLQCESVMDALWLERVAGEGRVQDGPRWGREPRLAGLSAGGAFEERLPAESDTPGS